MSKVKTGLGLVAAAALAVAISGPVNAAPAKSPDQTQTVKGGSAEMTDFSSQRRRARYYRRGPSAGAIAGAAAVGIIGSAIAAGAANDYYYGRPYYGPGYGYGYGPGYGYGYGPGYYRGW